MRLLWCSVAAMPLLFPFIHTSAVLPSVTTETVASGVNVSDIVTAQDLSAPFPYEFPYLGSASGIDALRFPMPKCNGIALEEATVDQLQDAMSSGQLTSAQLAICYLQRMYQTDPYIK